MAVQPPPVSGTSQQPAPAAAQPAAQKSSGCLGRGCGFGCGGCLVAVLLTVLLVVGGGYFFFVAQASAAVNAPANLVVFSQPVTVDHNPATSGQALNAGSEVATQHAGHAQIQFPDGSYVKMSPDTTVQIKAVQLQKTGNLQSVDVLQKAGRTLVNVQHLVGGANFKVGGHAVSAQVRGTQFEMLVRQNNTNLIKVFEGTVAVSGKTTVNLTAGQEVEADVIAVAVNSPRTVADPDTGGSTVRQTLSTSQLQQGLQDSGISLKVQGTSPSSARIYYYSNLGGMEFSWTVLFYAATPNLGAVITQVTFRGVNVTTQVLKYLGSAGAESISTIPQDFTVDRVYSCAAGGDTLMVIEGHR